MKLNEKLSQAEQHLEDIENQGYDHLEFEWEGIRFHASSTDNGPDSTITLKADLGRLYFTIEDRNQRAMALERLFTNNRIVDGRYHIGKQGDIHFLNNTKTDGQLKGAKLMSALTVILLESEKHLRSLVAHLKPA